MLATRKNDIMQLMDKAAFTRELAFAAQSINSNDKLKQADRNSILQAVFNVALTGLSLNPISKLASLTPRFVNGKVQCVLMPQYQGLVKLITDTGSVKNIYAYNVFEGDEFETILGTSVELVHKPKYLSKNITHTYAVAILPDGTKQIEVMSKEDIEFIRGLSDSYKAYASGKIKKENCIWLVFEDEMYRKTVIKRITKYLPKSQHHELWEKVNQAIEVDNSDYQASDSQIQYALHLINNSSFDDETKSQMETDVLNEITKADFEILLKKLEPNQIQDKDRIAFGKPYNQTDIKKTLKASA